MMMTTRRLLLISILSIGLAAGFSGQCPAADVAGSCSPASATANSVRKMAGVWSEAAGRQPILWPDLFIDGLSNYNPTIGSIRPTLPDPEAEFEDRNPYDPDPKAPVFLIEGLTFFPAFNPPDGFNGFTAGPGDTVPPEAFRDPAYIWLQPDPAETIVLEGGFDPKYGHGLDYVNNEPQDIPGGQEGIPVPTTLSPHLPNLTTPTPPADQISVRVKTDGSGELVQNVIAARPEVLDTEGNAVQTRCPVVLVPRRVPLWLVGVWRDRRHAAGSQIKAKIVYANRLNPGWPQVKVILLPDGIPSGTTRLYVSYYYPGRTYVAVSQYPLPMPYTVYRFTTDQENVTALKINPEILRFDPLRTDPNDADPANPALPGPNNPLLGVFRTPDFSGANYFTPGGYEAPNLAHSEYGLIRLSNLPAGGLPSGTTLYVKVSTNAVDHVYDNDDPNPATDTDYYAPTGTSIGKYCSKLGLIKLAQPLGTLPLPANPVTGAVDTGPAAFVTYRPLSRTTFTVGRPLPAVTNSITPYPAVPDYQGGAAAVGDKFVLTGDSILPLGTLGLAVSYYCRIPDVGPRGALFLNGAGSRIIMMHEPGTDRTYSVYCSAGLNMSNPKQWPSDVLADNVRTLNNRLIYDEFGRPMYYASALRGGSTPGTALLTATGGTIVDGKPEFTTSPIFTALTYGSSSYLGRPGEIDHGGGGNLDSLSCYPDIGGANWPYDYDVDPLSVEPIEESTPTAPDSGSSSTMFVFRVRYRNAAGLPPRPWLPESADPWTISGASGVVLFIDFNGTGDYRPHFMALEKPEAEPGDPLYDVYIYRLIPHHIFGIFGSPPGYPLQDNRSDSRGLLYDNDSYTSLAMGTYHYFFACSDDHVQFGNGSFVFENQSLLGRVQWGQSPSWTTRYSTGLDPTLQRSVTGYEEVARVPQRRYSGDGGATRYDYTIYADRAVRVPGFYEKTPVQPYEYKWKSSENPEVTCELRMPVADELFIRYDDEIYGSGRFFGTINDYRRCSNPSHRGTYTGGQYAALAESCGHESSQENVFRILYRSKYNEAPLSIRVYINNASEKNNPDTGNTPAHTYTPFTMTPRSDQVPPYNYTAGVWYEYKTSALSRGPHTYYFRADDGRHIARYPVRPDRFRYTAYDRAAKAITSQGDYQDWWVPTTNTAEERGTAAYYDNDYFPGPYINNPCVLSESSVTPGTGKQGQQFTYRVKYSDPDGQRPYTTNLVIEVNDKGDTRRVRMVPETPIVPPAPGAAESVWIAYRDSWKTGRYYVFDTASANDLTLAVGVRRYRFEFRDDWGRLADINDTLEGEWTYLPQGAGNWIAGPVISGNIAPTLYTGSVESQDGTANAATLWTWRVTYRDVNNDEPKLMKVYLGLLQADGRTIVWNDGHTMSKSDPGDNVYSDGANYYFQTRLSAVDPVLGGTAEAKQYYYAFEAFDGAAWATYRSSSSDELRSNAAGCFVNQPMNFEEAYTLAAGERTRFGINPYLAQQGTVSGSAISPSKWDDILVTAAGYMVEGVYLTEDLTGTNYLAGLDIPNRKLLLAAGFPAGRDRAWIKYQAQAPILGPLPVTLPAPVGVIPDALIYQNYQTNPTPILLDDQKNGWISETNPSDRGVLVMKGLAMSEGLPSKGWVVPENPGVIASVEGIYLTLDDALNLGTGAINYYDTMRLDEYPAIMQTWQVDPADPTRTRVIPIPGLAPGDAIWSDPTRIEKVLGVFQGSTNYYQGNPTLMWQEAVVPGRASVWPRNPDNIVSVEGVHLAMDQSLTNYLDPAVNPRSLQGGQASRLIVAPSNVPAIEQLLGVFLDAGLAGTNYYDPAAANPVYQPGDPYIYPTTALPLDTSAVFISYMAAGSQQVQNGTTFIGAVQGNDMLPISEVLGVYDNETLTGTNYYDPATANPPFRPDDTRIWLTQPMPFDSQVFIDYNNRGFRFGPYNEYLALTRELPRGTLLAYVAYHEPGDVTYQDGQYSISLSAPVPPGLDRVQVAVRPSTYKAGDPAIRTTYDLPLADDAADRTVYIRFSHIQYTHLLRGTATRQSTSSTWPAGTTHYTPDGWDVPNVRINGNMDDPTAGVVGIWLNSSRTGNNYLDPRRTSRYLDDRLRYRLTTPCPAGQGFLWARYYQNGEYYIDRWNRKVVFLSSKNPAANLSASYFFGTKMPFVLGANTPPRLQKADVTKECVSPITGSRSTQFVFSIRYSDPDGPNGQAPAFVRVYIDGTPYNMTPASAGTPAYNVGAVYTYTASGMSGGSHKYHFECSDGAAVAWFDANGGHQSYVGTIVEPVKDMDGPWVNNPPTLTSGLANPSGTIGTNQSVDYTVTYRDLDGNPPYFHDPVADLDQNGQPLGAEYDGSPRVWIDSGATDVAYFGTVGSLQPDPLDPTRRRTIVVTGVTAWTADQFAGKLMQMTSGAALGRVYLIQSNTTTSLTIATNNLEEDQVATGDKFRINGLLMTKLDPSQQDFAAGVVYKITVPRLAVGIHKYHFTARSREDKPNWLKAMLIAQGQTPLPYSSEARFPAAGDSSGPTVVSTPPTGNVAPVIGNTAETSLYNGPKVMSAGVASATRVNPVSAGQIRSVLGVYINADEAYTGVGTNYHSPSTTANPFTPGDTQIVLAPALPSIRANNALVQFGWLRIPSGGSYKDRSLWTVVPDAGDRIGTVQGVYLLSDTARSVNYYLPAAGDPTFPDANGAIPLTSRLPSNTDRVYVVYNPKTTAQAGTASGLTKADPSNANAIADVLGVYLATDPGMTGTNYYDPATASPAFTPGDTQISLTTSLPPGTANLLIKYVPWPPTYVRHFAFAPAGSPPVYLSGEPLTFRLNYRDADNDPPTYHDGVQGYIRVVFNTSGRTASLPPLNPPILDYTVNNLFSVTLTDVPEGTDKYRFEASDGYFPVRWPALGIGGSTANDYPIKVNYKPVIKSGTVDHTSGATTFTFSAVYQDKDNVAPPTAYGMVLRLTQVENPRIEYVKAMTRDPAVTNPNYANGVNFIVMVGDDVPLLPGRYNSVFEAHDGIQPAEPLVGPSIIVRSTNVAPIIRSFGVTPTAGKTGITFTYSGFYYDYDGDAPVALSGGSRVEGLTLIIDKGTASEKRLLMTMVPLPVPPLPAPPPVPDYTTPGGVEYRATISGRQLGAGQHTYLVIASDGTDDSTEVQTGVVRDGGLRVTTASPAIISSVVGVYTDSNLTGTNYYPPTGTFVAPDVNLGQRIPAGIGEAFVRYNRIPKDGPVLLVPYFGLEVRTVDGTPVTDRTVVGEQVLIGGQMFFPYNLESGIPSAIDNVTIQVTKPDGTAVALNASVGNITVNNPLVPLYWVGDIVVRYDGYVDPALATGNSVTLTASGQWTISAVWPGDAQWDRAETDTTIDGRNDIVQISVSGPSRTLAVADPTRPATSAMLVDMITPPMVIGSNDPGVIFGYDRALELQVVRWMPESSAYFRYGVGGIFPPLAPGDAVWIKPKATYPAAEPLGVSAVQRGLVLGLTTVQLTVPDSTVSVAGVYLTQALSGTNYYNPATATPPFRLGQTTVTLTTPLPSGTTEVWISYVIWPLTGVDEGWIALDNPAAAKADDGGEPRYYHTKYRLVKALSKAYPVQTDGSGNRVLDPVTRLPLLQPSSISLKTGWNMFGNIFFNWQRASQSGTPVAGAGTTALNTVIPTNKDVIGRVLGVFLTPSLTGTNYYVPGTTTQPYQRGDDVIRLNTPVPAGTSVVHIKYELYPRQDVGIPLSEVTVSYLGQKKSLADAKLAGWVADLAWRYDATLRDYVRVHAAATGAERALKAWSGYWIRSFVNCVLEINPNTSYNGSASAMALSTMKSAEAKAPETYDAPPPPPQQ